MDKSRGVRRKRISGVVRQIELRFGEPLNTLIPRLFSEYQTVKDVQAVLGVSKNTVKVLTRRIGYEIDTSPRLVKKAQVPA